MENNTIIISNFKGLIFRGSNKMVKEVKYFGKLSDSKTANKKPEISKLSGLGMIVAALIVPSNANTGAVEINTAAFEAFNMNQTAVMQYQKDFSSKDMYRNRMNSGGCGEMAYKSAVDGRR